MILNIEQRLSSRETVSPSEYSCTPQISTPTSAARSWKAAKVLPLRETRL